MSASSLTTAELDGTLHTIERRGDVTATTCGDELSDTDFPAYRAPGGAKWIPAYHPDACGECFPMLPTNQADAASAPEPAEEHEASEAHACPDCDFVGKSAQALGGHKNKHRKRRNGALKDDAPADAKPADAEPPQAPKAAPDGSADAVRAAEALQEALEQDYGLRRSDVSDDEDPYAAQSYRDACERLVRDLRDRYSLPKEAEAFAEGWLTAWEASL